ncbi:MAG TPA: TIGR00341 family protein [Rhizomicrobium sp.]|nr:TIGR00341 family protein [Rhizomicrobium sp.]
MPLRLVEVIAPDGYIDTVNAIADSESVIEKSTLVNCKDGHTLIRLLTRATGRQRLIDELQRALSSAEHWRVSLYPVDTSMPEKKLPEDERKERERQRTNQTREELFNGVWASATLSSDFILMSGLAATIAAAGLIQSNAAVVIGAMVLAPFLGPNIALALGAALGNIKLVTRGAIALVVGTAIAIGFGFVLAFVLRADGMTHELLLRTSVDPTSAVIALASGAAAALSLSSGTASALVGVMVAVALLPPAVTLGIAIELGYMRNTAGAAGLLLVNIAAVNLAALGIFFYRGIRPKSWLEQRTASQSILVSAVVCIILLAGALAVAYFLGEKS